MSRGFGAPERPGPEGRVSTSERRLAQKREQDARRCVTVGAVDAAKAGRSQRTSCPLLSRMPTSLRHPGCARRHTPALGASTAPHLPGRPAAEAEPCACVRSGGPRQHQPAEAGQATRAGCEALREALCPQLAHAASHGCDAQHQPAEAGQATRAGCEALREAAHRATGTSRIWRMSQAAAFAIDRGCTRSA